MAKRLGKDQRNKFLAEYAKNGTIDSEEYYAIHDKNGKVQIRKYKPKKSSESSDDANKVKAAPNKNTQATQVTPAPETPPETPKKEPKEKTL